MQTERYEGYKIVLKWLKDTLDIEPKYVTTDFETGLIKATKEMFPNAELVP